MLRKNLILGGLDVGFLRILVGRAVCVLRESTSELALRIRLLHLVDHLLVLLMAVVYHLYVLVSHVPLVLRRGLSTSYCLRQCVVQPV